MFSLNLLGPVTADMNGSLFTHFGTVRGQALFIYLALEHDHAHQREAIMHLLWPDMPLKLAQGNLRQTIYLLRKAFQDKGIAESPLLSARQTVQLNPDFPLAVHVHEFTAAAAAGTVESRQQAADIPSDDLKTIRQQAAETDPWQEAAVLLEDLTARGWEEKSQ